MKTRQQLFNEAWIGLKSQGFLLSTTTGIMGSSCRYRGFNGLKCAIGHCIPDSQYRVGFEGNTPNSSDDVSDEICAAAGICPTDRDWAKGLQSCHDGASGNPTDMEERLLGFARLHSLTIPK